jgi:hypothetical protein
MTAPRRAWSWLGTAASVRLITLGMLVYAIIIGGLVAGYAQVSNCVAIYSNAAARSTSERADAAAQDRAAQRGLAVALAEAETVEDVRAAAERVVSTIDENDQRRALSPPPPPPDERC